VPDVSIDTTSASASAVAEAAAVPPPSSDETLYVHEVSKRFGATQALNRVSLLLKAGEVHGLVGANGSGKSTLVKILAGYHGPDSGQARLHGELRELPLSTHDRRGIATIHQDLGLVEGLSVLENMVVSTGFGAAIGRPIRWPAERRRAGELLERMQLALDLGADVTALAPGQRTLVAVARAILELERAREADGSDRGHLLILDEPTAALSDAESVAVWQLLRRISAAGGAALLISHHLQEIRAHCDRVTVLRDGRTVLTAPRTEVTEGSLVQSMLGEAALLASQSPLGSGARHVEGGHSLSVADLHADTLHGLSFTIAPGEVLGVVGLLGMGQDELPYLLAGATKPKMGTIEVDGQALPLGDIVAARSTGVALIPQDRRRDGLWLEADGAENLGIVDPRRFVRSGRYRRRLELGNATGWIDKLRVVPSDPTLPVSGLSGGNQQKVLLAKWLQIAPRVVLLHEPTQGVDVGAKLEIHNILRGFARETGAAICLCSTDLEETEEMCDRVIVLRYGRAAGVLAGSEVRSHSILALASAA
jgi:ribose transport system ATP-binding protein